MNIAFFFFSGTGNTWWCADKMAEAFQEAGHNSEAVSIEKLTDETTNQLVNDAEVVGFGYPIYGSDLPQPMKEFILERLPKPDGPGKDAFVFCTQLIFSGDGGRVFEEKLADKGYTTRWSIHLNMPNNICFTVSPLPYTTDLKKIDRRLKKTERKIVRFTNVVLSERSCDQGKGPLSSFLGSMQRNPFRKHFHHLRNHISIDAETCTLCNRCVNICPSGNLVREGDSIRTTGTCVLCTRCYNFCPVQAVLYMGKPHKQKRGIPYRGPVPGFRPEELQV